MAKPPPHPSHPPRGRGTGIGAPAKPLAAAAVAAQTSWDGSPTTLKSNDSVTMTSTVDGSMIFAFQNLSPLNSQGQLTLTSGASHPAAYTAAALDIAPTILVRNWGGNNLNVTNTSPTAVPIRIQALGPGMPGQADGFLPTDTPTPVSMNGTLAGQAMGGQMRLVMQCDSGALGLFAVIGGPPDPQGDNAYVFAVNLARQPPPAGYTKTSAGNRVGFPLDWATKVFVAFFGPAQLLAAVKGSEPTATVTLQSL